MEGAINMLYAVQQQQALAISGSMLCAALQGSQKLQPATDRLQSSMSSKQMPFVYGYPVQPALTH
jgi:hypothetical protein